MKRKTKQNKFLYFFTDLRPKTFTVKEKLGTISVTLKKLLKQTRLTYTIFIHLTDRIKQEEILYWDGITTYEFKQVFKNQILHKQTNSTFHKWL